MPGPPLTAEIIKRLPIGQEITIELHRRHREAHFNILSGVIVKKTPKGIFLGAKKQDPYGSYHYLGDIRRFWCGNGRLAPDKDPPQWRF